MDKQKAWIKIARTFLESSLHPVPHEINELDWKSPLSTNKEHLSRHLSAFANQRGGGFLVYGIGANGTTDGIMQSQGADIIQKLGNIARDSLLPPQRIDHYSEEFLDRNILYIYVMESDQKPVHLRGKSVEESYLRSGGQTRKMSRMELGAAMISSRQYRFEELEARSCSEEEVANLIDIKKLISLLKLPEPETENRTAEILVNQKLLLKNNLTFSITNLGAVLGATDFKSFPGKERFPIRVIKYKGISRVDTENEREFPGGYGVSFQEVIRYVMSNLPTSEIIKDALRADVPIYPEIVVRELVANALIHRDFSITTTNPMIEIFSDRIEITNPGTLLPSIKIERIIDTAPESRNELFASFMRRIGVCEERGSGIEKALTAIELFGLPPIQFTNGSNFFKAVIYSPRNYRQMDSDERIRACYQHCVLRYKCGEKMTNSSFRKRLGTNQIQAWKIIDSAIERKLVKSGGSGNKSRRYAHYVPFWV